MDVLQWAITTVVGILGILIGRAWQKHDRNNQKDKEILDEIMKLLDDNTLSYCRGQNFAGTFDWERLTGLRKFMDACEHPRFYFLDKRLETIRKHLENAVIHFYRQLGLHSFQEDRIGSTQARIAKDREFENIEEYHLLEKKLNGLATELCKTFDELIKLGRQRL